MLTKLRALASLYRELGPRWTLFRLAYAFRLRTGIIRLQMPMGEWSDYQKHVGARSSRPTLPIPTDLPTNIPWNKQTAIAEADRILNGEIKYFAHEFIKTSFPPDWHKDYFSDVTLSTGEGSLPARSEILRFAQNDKIKHWSQISDDHIVARRALALPDEAIPNDEETASAKNKSASQRHLDIKYIWEPNRFAFVYTLVRAYSATHDEKYPEAFWTLIEDWAKYNPPNTGPNWMDGQEIALRLMAWTFGYNHFYNSLSTTSHRKEQFTLYVAAQAERIYKNISYAISTRSNHTISEAFGLWLVGLLFPELKNSEKYYSFGQQLLIQESYKQFFPDGSYSMYSVNYHRFALQIYLYMISLFQANNKITPLDIQNQFSISLDMLTRLVDFDTGQIPFYGSNDGALILPLNNCDFTDFRPLLQAGTFLLQGRPLFESGPWDEDMFWLFGKLPFAPRMEKPKKLDALSFPEGGVHVVEGENSKAILRCTNFIARPSHADQLHMDLWIRGHNIAIDAGTYLYSGEGVWRNGLAHTSAHNTVIVDHKDQMKMVSRFTWTNWSKGKVLKHEKNLWQGEHDGYKPVTHKRTVKALEGDRWLVIDNLTAKEPHHYALNWLLSDFPFEQKDNSILLLLNGMKYKTQVGLTNGIGDFSTFRADPNSTRGWRSRYYGHKEPAISLMLVAHQPQATFWTFFGFENDVVEIKGNILRINSETIQL